MKAVLKRIRNSKFSNTTLSFVVVCLFLLAKTKTPAPKVQSKPVEPVQIAESVQPVSELAVVTEEVPTKSERVFSKQLNRHRKTVARVAKTKAPKRQIARVKVSPKLNQMAEAGLLEAPQGSPFNLDPYESETVLDPQFSLAALFPRELPLNIHEGVVVANDTSSLWETLEEFPKTPQLMALVQTPVEPKPPTALVASAEEESEPAVTPSPLSVAAPVESESASPEPELVQPKAGRPPVSTQNLQPLKAAPTEIESVVEQGKRLLENIQKTLVPAPAPKTPSLTTHPKRNPNRNPVPGVESLNIQSNEPVGQVYGKLTFDGAVHEWIENHQGHVELSLQRKDSRDPQDRVFIDYQYPEKEFTWDGREVAGSYQLVASFFNPTKSVPVAQIVYPTALTSETAKRRVVFHITKEEVEGAVRSAVSKNLSGIVLSGTVFEANPADHKSEKTISSAQVEILGYPQWGVISTESDGTFRIPNVTANSEFVVQVKAEGYYPTQVVVPVFQTTGYVSVHLVPKKHIETVTQFFTKRPQSDQKALIMGRVFNPETRSPHEDQEISLSGRSSPPLYFNLLPDLKRRQTTSMGSFAFFNVDPAFRSVGKSGSAVTHLIQAKPGSAYYLESGRAGKHVFRGTLLDPYRQQRVAGLIKIVGAPTQVETDAKGEFEISGIDLPPGVITFEVVAEGYPTSWHTVPWSSRDNRASYTFYLPETELLEEVQSSVARVSEIPHRGTVLGGAEASFFANKRRCVFVSLEKTDGQSVSLDHGPFPLHQDQKQNAKGLCLSSHRPGFSFFNLEPGEYLLKWRNARGELLRSHVTRVGADRTSILIN
ncbi:MAG: hypothetical protein EBQ92_14035 [Proteobacteria bacterium]|nr:hypothetical protein [Pseudomonadota bacterium]